MIKYVHHNLDNGPSPYFPAPSILENDGSDGWPEGTVKVEWDHGEHTSCCVLEDGSSYTTDVDGYGYDELGEFYLGTNGIERSTK